MAYYKVTGIRVRLDVIVPPELAEERAQKQREIEARHAARHEHEHPDAPRKPVVVTTGDGAYLYVDDALKLTGEALATYHVSSSEEWW